MENATVKVGQVWRDKDKRRQRLGEVLSIGEGEAHVLIVGTEQETSLKLDRFAKRWELLSEKAEKLTEAKDQEVRKITREQWLEKAADLLRTSIFAPKDFEVPPVRVSVGWPGGRGPKAGTIGQCWPPEASTDKVGQIFVSPVLHDSGEVLATLVHEMVHAINHANGDTGHRGPFATIAKAVGLEGKMTSTHAGEALASELGELADELGEYPHSPITLEHRPKVQKTYMVKLIPGDCFECDPKYLLRTTQKWIDEGLPKCPHNVEMIVE